MKKYLLGIMAIVFAVVFSAFTKTETVKPMDGEKWFELEAGGDPSVAADYSLYGNGSTEPSCTGSNVCAKLAVPDAQNPDIPNLSTTISTKFRPTP
ncbi:MAG TPA: hypothetical protein PKC39_05005 [Ferruginibacter sp.]|jgi:hypothetical protein|nr:hypothetical protein [Ferruginibacter sp.]HMP20299.1 hypothetical protein [Ferruginibacter sp.]